MARQSSFILHLRMRAAVYHSETLPSKLQYLLSQPLKAYLFYFISKPCSQHSVLKAIRGDIFYIIRKRETIAMASRDTVPLRLLICRSFVGCIVRQRHTGTCAP
jgi:hypothetical protein